MLLVVAAVGCEGAPPPTSAPPVAPRPAADVEVAVVPTGRKPGRAQAAPRNHVVGLRGSPDRRALLVVDEHGLHVWDAVTFRERRVAALPADVRAFGFVDDGRVFVATYGAFPAGGALVVRGVDDDRERTRIDFTGFAPGPFVVAQGSALYGAHGAGSHYTLGGWDLAGQAEPRVFAEVDREATAVALSPGGALVAFGLRGVGGAPGTTRLFDARTGADRGALTTDAPNALVFLDDDRLAVTALQRGTAVWSASRREALVRYESGGYALASAPSGRSLVVVGLNELHILDTASAGGARTVADAHAGEIAGVTFLEEDRFITAGGLDCTLKLWSASTGASVATHRFPTDPKVR